jgi:radical SAM protein with 4Fe4S-binding SPASM domain
LEGELDNLLAERYRDLGLVTTRKIFKEGKKEGTVIYNLVYPMIPEHGICQDLLSHLCIDSNGLVYACVRFDPEKKGLLGDVKKDYIDDIWNSEKRKKMLYLHERGLRNKIPLCKGCEYYGIPVEAR